MSCEHFYGVVFHVLGQIICNQKHLHLVQKQRLLCYDCCWRFQLIKIIFYSCHYLLQWECTCRINHTNTHLYFAALDQLHWSAILAIMHFHRCQFAFNVAHHELNRKPINTSKVIFFSMYQSNININMLPPDEIHLLL